MLGLLARRVFSSSTKKSLSSVALPQSYDQEKCKDIVAAARAGNLSSDQVKTVLKQVLPQPAPQVLPDFLLDDLSKLVKPHEPALRERFCELVLEHDTRFKMGARRASRFVNFLKCSNSTAPKLQGIHLRAKLEQFETQTTDQVLGHVVRKPLDGKLAASVLLKKGEHLAVSRMKLSANELEEMAQEYSVRLDPAVVRSQYLLRKSETLQLPGDVQIIHIDTVDALEKARAKLSRTIAHPNLKVSMDVEWFPRGHAMAEIVQFGIGLNYCLILDVGRNSKLVQNVEYVNQTLCSMFEGKQCVVFGGADFEVLTNRSPKFSFWTCFGSVLPPVPPKSKRAGGLSGLCTAVLGKPLDKDLQQSDWAARPLSREQIEYACTDVWCLIKIRQLYENGFYRD